MGPPDFSYVSTEGDVRTIDTILLSERFRPRATTTRPELPIPSARVKQGKQECRGNYHGTGNIFGNRGATKLKDCRVVQRNVLAMAP